METKICSVFLLLGCLIAVSTASGYKKGGHHHKPGHTIPHLTGWSEWKPWSSCSKTCGGGVQSRSRVCRLPVRVHKHFCAGSSRMTRSCNTQPCPVDGMWSEWTDGSCSVTCEQGTLVRTRQCNNPAPSNGGNDCVGPSSETAVCDTGVDCPVDGMWSEWSDGPCSVTCGEGQLTRTRQCNNPPPSNGGMDCVGDSSETATCDTEVNCPIDGEWSDWDDWSSCSKTCKGGVQTRTRECDDPAPQFGGEDCDGPNSETRSCRRLRYIPCIDVKHPKHPDYTRNIPEIDVGVFDA